MMAKEDAFEAIPVVKRATLSLRPRHLAQRCLLIKGSFSVIFPFREGFMSKYSDIYRRFSVNYHCLISFTLMFTYELVI